MTAPLIQGASGIEGATLTSASIKENNKDIFTFTSNELVTWSIDGGEETLFTIDTDTGELSFNELPDYEKAFSLNGTTLEFQTNYNSPDISSKFFVELYDLNNKNNQSTPITSDNFLQYVNDGSYIQTILHRLVSDFIVQGGGFNIKTNANQSSSISIIQSKGAISNEPGNSNHMGTIAMAKISGQANSATSEWFINLLENKHLDSQNEGFTVFGHILGDGINNPLLLNKLLKEPADTQVKTFSLDLTFNDASNGQSTITLPDIPLRDMEGTNVAIDNFLLINKISSINTRPQEIENKYNLIVSATDSDGNKSSQYVIVTVSDIQGEQLNGADGIDTLTGGIGNDIFQGNGGNDIIDGGNDYDTATYSGNFSDYIFEIANKLVTVTDTRSSTNDGTDTLSNIEKLTFADKNALITSKEIKGINSLGFHAEKIYQGKSDAYKFYDLGNDKYGIGITGGIDELTGPSVLKFDDKILHLVNDIKATFDQVTGLHDATGQMFRLYNAAFARFPDADGLKYWIGNFSSGKDDSRAVSSSFLASEEFKQRYGDNVSNESYVKNLYLNVLNRELDQGGYDYWVGNLNNGIEERHEVLLGFSESAENKGLFSEMTGLY